MNICEIIENSARLALKNQKADGSFPPGHNGPYNDPETPVRNTAHWLFTLCSLYEKTGESKYLNPARKAAEYLTSANARPMRASFWSRKNPQKDLCNGLIGQAWAIEALVLASKVLQDVKYYRVAEEVFLLHPWDQKNKIWRRVNVDGSFNTYDPTFNHQLWFAAIGSLLSETPDAIEQSFEFLSKVAVNVETYSDGVIFHNSLMGENRKVDYSKIHKASKTIFTKVKNKRSKRKLKHKSVGYHSFNLYAFALLSIKFTDFEFWHHPKFNRMIEITRKKAFQDILVENEYAYPYNPVGIEMAFSLETLKLGSRDEIISWLDKQIRITGKEDSIMTRGSMDPRTSDARIYEALRLKESYEIEIPW